MGAAAGAIPSLPAAQPRSPGAPKPFGLLTAVLKRATSNPALLAVYAALAINFLGLPLPPVVDAITAPLAAANKPLALLALGNTTRRPYTRFLSWWAIRRRGTSCSRLGVCAPASYVRRVHPACD